MALLEIDNLTKNFQNGEVEEQVLKGIDLKLKKGKVSALVGASGSGKSTLLTIAAGLQPATDGEIVFNGKDLTEMKQDDVRQIRAEQFGFIFQASHLVPFLTVEEQLVLMLDVANSKLNKKERKEEAVRILKLVGMEEHKDAYPASLSGGEKQRIAISRAIIHQPSMLFADEPTASLDSKRSKEVMQLIQELTRTLNITTLLVTHEEGMLQYADHVITMKDGLIKTDEQSA